MSSKKPVVIFENRPALIAGIADRFATFMSELLARQDVAHIVLTGGTVGIDSLAAIGDPSRSSTIDWNRVHVWWGDERWLPSGDGERNEVQADAVLLTQIDCPAVNIHRFPSAGGDYDLDAAARAYAAELEASAAHGDRYPKFDLVFLGVGPDGHIASLFPGHDGIRERDETVIPVRDSPKPPPERLSLTLPVINAADQVWMCLAGADKAPALGLALAGANISEVPAAGAFGRQGTVFLVDQAAASEVPDDLLRAGGAS